MLSIALDVQLWDVTKFKLPLAIVTDVATLWPTTNVAFSPDGSLMIAGTAIKRSGKSTKPPKAASGDQSDSEPEELSSEFGHLKAFNLDALLKSGSCSVEDAVYSLQVCKDAVVCLNWHPLTKQIVAGCGDGVTRVFYDPTITEKGAMLSAARAPAR
jgi:WD repeat-containing protein 70